MFVETVAAFTAQQVARVRLRGRRPAEVLPARLQFVDFVDKDDTVLLLQVDASCFSSSGLTSLVGLLLQSELHRVLIFRLTRFSGRRVLTHRRSWLGHLFQWRRGHDFNAQIGAASENSSLYPSSWPSTQFLRNA
ncbi:hypothetical protein LAD77_01155 [Klebsiella pneumoniae]|nr:hypothetical protein [Klebsiella pneumoniae]